MRGWSLGALGRAKEGIPLLLEGLAAYRETGARLALPFLLTTLAETYARAGLAEEGLSRLDEAAGVVDITQERWAEAEMLRMRGSILLDMNQPLAAEKCYQQALTVARRQGARSWELRAATNLARVWRRQGKHAAARDLLSPCYKWFSEGLDTPVLRDAREELRQLGPDTCQ